MRFKVHGCGPGGRFDFPEGLFAMGSRGFGGGFGRGWGGGDWGGWGPGGGGGGGRQGRGGGRRGMFRPGELRLVLLRLIADQPRHGYDLIQSIEEMTGGEYAPSPGVVYPTLTMLEDMGFIREQVGEGSSRKAYAVTPEGQAHLDERREEAEALIERLAEHGERQRRAGGAPISRAVGNLLSALWHRVQREGMNDETLHQIAEILDEAARKVERL
jgi:DNA-binding PadR family transcriptional regulator